MSRLGIEIHWLGHSAFRLTPKGGGPTLLIDPWIENPAAPADAAQLAASAEAIVVTHGHWDHATGTKEIALETGATVLTTVEMAADFAADGIPDDQLIGFNIGGAAEFKGLRVTLVQAMHSSARDDSTGRPREVGPACGVVLEFPGGPIIYNTGDTGVFGDMALIAELYRPSILMLPIGDFYTMGARQAAKAVELVDPEWIVPQHHGTFPGLPGTIEEFRAALPVAVRERLIELQPGEMAD